MAPGKFVEVQILACIPDPGLEPSALWALQASGDPHAGRTYLLKCGFIRKKHKVNAEKCTQLSRAQECTERTCAHTSASPRVLSSSVRCHTYPHLEIQLCNGFQITLHHFTIINKLQPLQCPCLQLKNKTNSPERFNSRMQMTEKNVSGPEDRYIEMNRYIEIEMS